MTRILMLMLTPTLYKLEQVELLKSKALLKPPPSLKINFLIYCGWPKLGSPS